MAKMKLDSLVEGTETECIRCMRRKARAADDPGKYPGARQSHQPPPAESASQVAGATRKTGITAELIAEDTELRTLSYAFGSRCLARLEAERVSMELSERTLRLSQRVDQSMKSTPEVRAALRHLRSELGRIRGLAFQSHLRWSAAIRCIEANSRVEHSHNGF